MAKKQSDEKKPSDLSAAEPALLPVVQPGTAVVESPVLPVSVFPIVGIGASAGGLEAFEAFFRACPVDTGMAFVLVPHLDPGHGSLLSEILQRCTTMPVVEALDQVAVAPDHVYVIPPNREMALLNGVLQLSIPEQVRGQRMPIDNFLRTLAEDRAERAIGIVLSGTGTDGTLGLRAIQGAGGLCLVQEPSTARYDGMPRSAIDAGYSTHILAVEQMPAALVESTRTAAYRQRVPVAPAAGSKLSGLNRILLQLRSSTGHDFSLYKKSTIGRRIERRMGLHKIDDEAAYARYLRENPAEIQLLFKELLINVTGFFRDPTAFTVLKQTILPALVAGQESGYNFRVWIPGCATGEEAYSIAMLLLELQDELRARHEQELNIQIYATDLDDEAVDVARSGRYPLNIAQDVTPERLARFFIKSEAGYKVKKELRDLLVFAVQNVIKDPPFTRLDLLSCRNLMIYLETELQDRLIPNFHYALKPNGVLFLSTSESITNQPHLFVALDRKWKFYRAIQVGTAAARAAPRAWSSFTHAANRGEAAGEKQKSTPPGSLAAVSAQALLQHYSPVSVTTDSRGNIQYVHGDTGAYLRPAPGLATNNVVEMAREGLQLELRRVFQQVNKEGRAVIGHPVTMKTASGHVALNLDVRLLPRAVDTEPLLLISFHPAVTADAEGGKKTAGARRGRAANAAAETLRIAELESELAHSRENLQITIEEQQASNEELKSTNEELQSTNEELQSSNEELETSKEELQSLNEETITVNAELNAKIEQLTSIRNDMKNLLDSINTGTIFLDHDLLIRRYTPPAVNAFRLIATDVGRPLGDITSHLDVDLTADLQAVLDSLIPVEREVRSGEGGWYLARIQPYRTLDNVIEGVVLTLTDVSKLKRISEAAQAAAAELAATKLAAVEMARTLAVAIVDTVSKPLVVLDGTLKVVSASRSFYQYFKVAAEATVGRKIYDLGNGQWNIPALRELLEHILPQDQKLDDFVVEHVFPEIGWCRLELTARRIATTLGTPELILLSITKIETKESA